MVRERSSQGLVSGASGLAFDHFNWGYGLASAGDEVESEGKEMMEEAAPVARLVAAAAGKSWAEMMEEDDEEGGEELCGEDGEYEGEEEMEMMKGVVAPEPNLVATVTKKSWADMAEEDDDAEDLSKDFALGADDFAGSLPNDPEPSIATLAVEEVAGEQAQVAVPKLLVQEEPAYSYEQYFWDYIYNTPEGQANPFGIQDHELYQEPAGDYRALSFDGQPQRFVASTPPAVSLWAVASSEVLHWQHGSKDRFDTRGDNSPFSRKSVLSAQACKTLTPVQYFGAGTTLRDNVGTALQEAVTGHVYKSFLPVGRIMTGQKDPEDPHTHHIPTHPHWSHLTLPKHYTTPPYYYKHDDYDHSPPPFPYGPSKRKVGGTRSPLHSMQLCEEAVVVDVSVSESQDKTQVVVVEEGKEADEGEMEMEEEVEEEEQEAGKAQEVAELSTTTSPETTSPETTSPDFSPPTPLSPTHPPAITFEPGSLNAEIIARLKVQIEADIKALESCEDGEGQDQEEEGGGCEVEAEANAEAEAELLSSFSSESGVGLSHLDGADQGKSQSGTVSGSGSASESEPAASADKPIDGVKEEIPEASSLLLAMDVLEGCLPSWSSVGIFAAGAVVGAVSFAAWSRMGRR